MRLLLTGGTGFIGRALRETLVQKGHELTLLTRQSSKEYRPSLRTRYVHWNPDQAGSWERELDGVEGVLNFAGEPIAGKRWSEAQKQLIVESRISATRAIVSAIQKAKRKPSFLLNASAIGYYGPQAGDPLTEGSPAGGDFLARTCQAWEAEALRAEGIIPRVIRLRIGIVLGKEGGALAKMLTPFRLGLGGPLGSGRQWMSWIHLKDLAGIIDFILDKKEIRGPLNGTAPQPVVMKEFSGTLGRALHRPAIFPVPAWALKVLAGEMSDLFLNGQQVLPKRVLEAGYPFQFPELGKALEEILSS